MTATLRTPTRSTARAGVAAALSVLALGATGCGLRAQLADLLDSPVRHSATVVTAGGSAIYLRRTGEAPRRVHVASAVVYVRPPAARRVADDDDDQASADGPTSRGGAEGPTTRPTGAPALNLNRTETTRSSRSESSGSMHSESLRATVNGREVPIAE